MSEHKMGHIQDFSIYIKVLLALIGLTFATVLVSLVDFGIFNTLVALLVAFIKASLVVLYFMHGKYEDRVTWAFVYYPIFLLMTLIGALFLDYGFRDHTHFANIPQSYDQKHPEAAHGATTEEHGDSHEAVEVHSEETATDDGHSSSPAAAIESSDHAAPAVDEMIESHEVESQTTAIHGDIEAGRAKAKILCIACHKVDGNGNELPGAPPFAQTANDASKTPELLRNWIKNPQEVKAGSLMPNLGLSDEEVDNLIAYINTYKK